MRAIVPPPTIETAMDCEYSAFTTTSDWPVVPPHSCIKVKYLYVIQSSVSSKVSFKGSKIETIKCNNFEDCCNKWEEVRCYDGETPTKTEKDLPARFCVLLHLQSLIRLQKRLLLDHPLFLRSLLARKIANYTISRI